MKKQIDKANMYLEGGQNQLYIPILKELGKMNNNTDLFKITKTLRLASHISKGFCQECSDQLPKDLDETSNHYIQKHAYNLLFIGSETDRDYENNIVTNTIIFLGKK